MTKKLTIPIFRNEREAAWWDKHRAEVEADLRKAIREGNTTTLTAVLNQAKVKKALRPVTIRLPVEDVTTAQQLAAAKGIGYQTYIKLLLHQALRREAVKRAPETRR